MTMTTTEQHWRCHIAAIKAQAITAKAYAKQHGLVLSTLYYWQGRLKAGGTSQEIVPTATAAQPGKFMALQLKTAQHPLHPVAAANCTLVLGAGMRLEMTALPEPQWLVALARCAHGAH
jgi:hypothetical protein